MTEKKKKKTLQSKSKDKQIGRDMSNILHR